MTMILTVSRKVIEVNPKFEASGKRFAVKDYPKDKEYRRLKLSPQLVRKIEAHVRSAGLEPGDLLFAHRAGPTVSRPLRTVPDPATLGLTKPNEKAAGIGTARSRLHRWPVPLRALPRSVRGLPCQTARRVRRSSATARRWVRWPYSAQLLPPQRLATGLPGCQARFQSARARPPPCSCFVAARRRCRPPGRERATRPRVDHDHAEYLHTLPDADETAVEAFSRIRNRTSPSPRRGTGRSA